MRKVILLQAIRLVISPLASCSVAIVKDTSLASAVPVNDLLKQATDTQALLATPAPLVLAALICLAMLWPLVRFSGWIEKRAKVGEHR